MAFVGLEIEAEIQHWPLKQPFAITGKRFDSADILWVTLTWQGLRGYGEAYGVYYHGETAATLLRQIEQLRPALSHGVSRATLPNLLTAGGARNALDCALWDLEARARRMPVWQLAGLRAPRPVTTTFTCGVDIPKAMAGQAAAFPDATALKIKLSGDDDDADRVRAVRAAMPHAWLGVDANQGFTPSHFERLMPTLTGCGVRLVEQPFPVGSEAWLDDLDLPIPIAADESVQTPADLDSLIGRVQVINIKLDKCGGLTAAVALMHAARARGFDVMVGNMFGTSISISPAYLLAQACDVVDLDGPTFLTRDRSPAATFANGQVHCGPDVWGAGGP